MRAALLDPWLGQNDPMLSRSDVRQWVDRYEAAWRSPDTDVLRSLFSEHAQYLHSPYAKPIVGLPAIAQMWEVERDGPDEVFTLESEVVALEDATAVVRVHVSYGNPVRQEYRDLWVIEFDDEGRCSSFEEWPFWPDKPWSSSEEQ